MINKYHSLDFIEKSELERILSSQDEREICEGVIRGAYHIKDIDWLLLVMEELLLIDSVNIKGAVLTSIGHLARLNPKINKEKLFNLLEPFLNDPDLAGRAEDAMDDIEVFINKT